MGVQTSVDKVVIMSPEQSATPQQYPSDYSGGLQGGGMSAFAIPALHFNLQVQQVRQQEMQVTLVTWEMPAQAVLNCSRPQAIRKW